MKTAQILAILVVLLFVSSCVDNTQKKGETPVDTTKPQDNADNGATETTPTTPTTPSENKEQQPEEMEEQPETPVKIDDKEYPVLLTAEKIGDKVKLTWTPFPEKFMSYKVMRSTTDINPKYPGADLIETVSNIGETTYTDTSPQAGVNYYSVGVLTLTNKGEMSNVVSVEFSDPKEKQGNTITLNAEKTADGVSLSWNQYDQAAGQLLYYKIVRSDTNPTPKYPNDISIAAQPYLDKTTYIDRAARPGKTYYYSITVVRKDYTRYTSAPVTVTT